MKILVNRDNVIVAISAEMRKQFNGVYIPEINTVFGEPDLEIYEIENIPDEVEPIKYLYLNGEFIPNPSYVEFKTPEEEIEELKERINLMQKALDDLILGGGL